MVRAWPGGFGNCKVGANYGPAIIASAAAAQQGFDQILWLLGGEKWVTEAGACNFFAVVKPKGGLGRTQLLTAPLGNGVVLPGVTRTSVLETVSETLANELDVVERNFSIHELIDAASDGRLVECFVCGTAFFITPVGEISYEGRAIGVPVGDERGRSGNLVEWLRERLSAIMHGDIEHPWAYVVEEVELGAR
jgi:branched-chain amino acid aminotransferase